MDFNPIDLVLHLDTYLSLLVNNYGAWIYAILFLVIFCETGLVVTPFLPGDSLLFIAGAICATGGMDPWVLGSLLLFAAISGDSTNYVIGRTLGKRLFSNPDSKVFRRDYLDQTHAFYERHGGKTVTLARFLPIVRTFAPFVAGMAYMPADRGHRALVRDMTVAENLMLRDSRHEPYARGWLLDGAGRTRSARRLMADYDIRAAGPGAITARLSGGNQQKVVIARELDRSPAVLVAHQAAWGLDPGATRFVLDRVIGLRDAGAAVLYVSSELEEVLAISDRIAVMSGGSFVAIVRRAEADLRQIGLWMAGRAA